ncbi:hypothetical protein Tco_0013476 [Tanacetum coccineum]
MKYYVQSTNRWAKREDPKFKTLEDKQRACADRFERVGLTMIAIIQFSIQHSYHARQSSPHQSKALYVESGHLPVCWTEVWRSSKPRVQNYSREPTEKIIQIKQGSSGIRIDQKSYADLKRKPMEFQVRDKVMLKVSPWKGGVRFGKRGKLNLRYVRPFKVLEKVGEVAYKLEIPEELSRVHNTFHVSNLKKCHADEPLAVLLDGLHLDDNFICLRTIRNMILPLPIRQFTRRHDLWSIPSEESLLDAAQQLFEAGTTFSRAAELIIPRLTTSPPTGRDYYVQLTDLGGDIRRRVSASALRRRVTYQVDVALGEFRVILQKNQTSHAQVTDRCSCGELRLKDLARSEAHSRALEARVTVLETEARRHEWQAQAADDLAI